MTNPPDGQWEDTEQPRRKAFFEEVDAVDPEARTRDEAVTRDDSKGDASAQ